MWAYFHDKPLYIFCFYNWTSRKQYNTKQSSKYKRSLHITERKRFADRACGRPQELRKKPFPKSYAQPLAKLAKILCPLLLPPLWSLWTSETNDLYKPHIKKIVPKKTINNAKLNKNLKVRIQSSSSSSKKINIQKTTALKSCFVPSVCSTDWIFSKNWERTRKMSILESCLCNVTE